MVSLNGKQKRLTVVLVLTILVIAALFLFLASPAVELPLTHEAALRAVVPPTVWENSEREARRVHGGYLVHLSFVDSEARPVTYTYRVQDDLTVTEKQVIVGYGHNFPLNVALAFLFGCILLCYATLIYMRDRRKQRYGLCQKDLTRRKK